MENNMKDGHSWKYCGCFAREYNVHASELARRQEMLLDNENPDMFRKCYECGKDFAQEETPFIAFYEVRNKLFQMKSICKECAYKVSQKITDYEVTGEAVKFTEITKESWEEFID